jgi:hypothetical protein
MTSLNEFFNSFQVVVALTVIAYVLFFLALREVLWKRIWRNGKMAP